MKIIFKPFLYIIMCCVILAAYFTKAAEDCVSLFKQEFLGKKKRDEENFLPENCSEEDYEKFAELEKTQNAVYDKTNL